VLQAEEDSLVSVVFSAVLDFEPKAVVIGDVAVTFVAVERVVDVDFLIPEAFVMR
jgi:hypothetical protein